MSAPLSPLRPDTKGPVKEAHTVVQLASVELVQPTCDDPEHHKGTALVFESVKPALLHDALIKGDTAVLLKWLSSGSVAFAEEIDSTGRFALHLCASLDQHASLQLLLSHGANANQLDESGWSPLHDAVSEQCALMLLHFGADIEARTPTGTAYSGRTALMLAVEKDNAPLTLALLQHGADVLTRDDGGFSPLYLAVARGCVSTTEAIVGFLQQGKYASVEDDGISPPTLSSCNRRVAGECESTEMQADVNSAGRLSKPGSLLSRTLALQHFEDGWTPLHGACFYEHASIVRILLAAGSIVHAAGSSNKSTPLHILCESRAPANSESLCPLCSGAAGGDAQSPSSSVFCSACTPCASSPRHTSAIMDRCSVLFCLRALLNAEAPLHIVNVCGETPLGVAVTAAALSSVSRDVAIGGTKSAHCHAADGCCTMSDSNTSLNDILFQCATVSSDNACCRTPVGNSIVSALLTHACDAARRISSAQLGTCVSSSSGYYSGSLDAMIASCRTEIVVSEAFERMICCPDIPADAGGASSKSAVPSTLSVLWRAAEAGSESAIVSLLEALEARLGALDRSVLSLTLCMTSKSKGRTVMRSPFNSFGSIECDSSFISADDAACACCFAAKICRSRLINILLSRCGLEDETAEEVASRVGAMRIVDRLSLAIHRVNTTRGFSLQEC